jgi:hypothetical protein
MLDSQWSVIDSIRLNVDIASERLRFYRLDRAKSKSKQVIICELGDNANT